MTVALLLKSLCKFHPFASFEEAHHRRFAHFYHHAKGSPSSSRKVEPIAETSTINDWDSPLDTSPNGPAQFPAAEADSARIPQFEVRSGVRTDNQEGPHAKAARCLR